MMRICRILLGLILIVAFAPPRQTATAQLVVPVTWDVVSDNFESGSLAAWSTTSPGNLSLVAGGGHNATTGLSVAMGQSARYIHQAGVAYAKEGYLTFWFNPNGVALPEPSPNYWPPGSSLGVAEVRSSASDWWPPLAGFYVRKPSGQGYKGYLAWPKASGYFYDYASGQFDLSDGWQKITLGYKMDMWVAVWVNDVLVRSITADVVHDDPSGDVIEFGKVNSNSSTTPGGSIRLDDVAFQVPRVDDVWVNANGGNDANNGLTQSTALRTIQKAADLAGPGTRVHILPGVYRETVRSALSGSAAEPAYYIAENGPGTAVIRGSEPSSSLAWTQLTANNIGLRSGVDPTKLYYADLTAWQLDGPPRFIVEDLVMNHQAYRAKLAEASSTLPDRALERPLLSQPADSSAGMVRLPLAREPDWNVVTEWKTHEFWWAANGGSTVAGCDPATNSNHNCDLSSRSMTQLTDNANDTEPTGIEGGNLTTLGDLTGATLVAIDTYQGHYVYRRTITAHDVGAGRVTVDKVCEHDGGSGNPGLGWGSKYYVENHPALLDSPGEWWYDTATRRLYLWPPSAGNPATMHIEISRRDHGFNLQNRSYITLDGLTIELLDKSAIYLANWENHKSYHDTVRNVLLRYANWGLYIEQDVSAAAPAGNLIDGFTLENSEIAYVDTLAIRLIDWWDNHANPDSFVRSGIVNTVIRDNEMHHLGFRTDDDNAVGASFTFTNKLRFERNHVHHVAHNGVQFSRSVIQSSKTYGFAPSEIKTGEILVKDNVFEKACQLTTDCGGLKLWGSPPDNHVFRDVLITGNIFRDTFGWTWVSEKRRRWTDGTVHGLGGFGLYVDHASGIHAYRNVAYNNAYTGYMFSGVWRDGQMVYVNNVAANSLYGFALGSNYDTHGSVDTRVINNLMINNEAFGMTVGYAAGRYANMTIDYNLYHANGWGGMWHAGPMVVREDGSWEPQQTLAEVQANTPWEDHGVSGDPAFRNYTPSDHDLHDGSWPDFHLTAASVNAIDRGTAALPASLVTLLTRFGVDDARRGTAYDIGRYEGGFDVQVTPPARAVELGGVATFTLRLDPPDWPHAVTLTLSSPSPYLAVTPGWATLVPGGSVTLTVTDGHTGTTLLPGVWYSIPITGAGGGFTQAASARLLVGGARVYLPVVYR